jgi:hypothetical protein
LSLLVGRGLIGRVIGRGGIGGDVAALGGGWFNDVATSTLRLLQTGG